MEYAMTKMSTKGQIVIPRHLREEFSPGEEFLVVKEGSSLVLKSVSALAKTVRQELEVAARIEEAYQEYDREEYVKMEFDEFIEEMKKW